MKLATIVAALAASASISVAAPPTKCNLSTDAGIDAAYKAATGKELSTYGGRCAERSTTFPTMIAIGEFASDYGCRWEGALHGCAWNEPSAAATAMAAAGWAKADAAKRGKLAVAWLTEVDQLRPEDATSSVVAGKLVVELWITAPVGMRDEPQPRTHHKVTFNADGSHGALAND